MKRIIFLSATIVALLSGCTLAPGYNRPESPVPVEWPKGPAYHDPDKSSSEPVAAIPWREFFSDEKLLKLVEIALENNRDFRIAALNVELARAVYGIQRAELFPVIEAWGSGNRQRILAGFSGSDKAVTFDQYSAHLGVTSWEIDFFGRTQSLKDRALEEYFATEEARRASQILLISEVASAYLSLAAQRENLNLAQSTLVSRESAADLIRRHFEVGTAAELDFLEARSRADAARADVALYTRRTAENENALALLIGVSVPVELLPADLNTVVSRQQILPGVPSEVLLQRPDILAAEHNLKGANAAVGAARAAFFPSISLTSAVGTASGELSGLFKAGSDIWNFTPQITMPIFDPRTWSALDATEAENMIVLARYEKAVQNSFREVADALAMKGTIDEQLAAQESSVDAAAAAYRLADARYAKGIDSYLTVLDAQRTLYGAQQGLINVRLLRLGNQVKLYAVLGGGGV